MTAPAPRAKRPSLSPRRRAAALVRVDYIGDGYALLLVGPRQYGEKDWSTRSTTPRRS